MCFRLAPIRRHAELIVDQQVRNGRDLFVAVHFDGILRIAGHPRSQIGNCVEIFFVCAWALGVAASTPRTSAARAIQWVLFMTSTFREHGRCVEQDSAIRTRSTSGVARDNWASADLTSSSLVVRVTMETPKPTACGPLPRGSGRGRRVGYLAVLLAGRFVSCLACLYREAVTFHSPGSRPGTTA